MAGPWEQYQSSEAPTPAAAVGPWTQYQPSNKSAAPEPTKRDWADVPLEALKNLPSSAGNMVSGIYNAVRHPIDTASNLLDVGAGALQNIAPQFLLDAAKRIDPNPKAAEEAVSKANAVGGFYKDRYGSMEGLKNTLATDPVGVASDISTVLSGGGMLAGKVGLTGAGNALRTAGRTIDPLSAAARGGAAIARGAGNAAANIIGGIGTHTGAETLKQAFRSGREGGESAKAFRDNLRGNVPITDVLDDAKANIQAMGQAKSDAYRQNMSAVTADRSVLSFNGIDQAVSDAAKVATFKGQVKNTRAAQLQQAIADNIAEWKALDPAEFHTPEGLDALKQRIGGLVESIPFEEKTARMVGTKVYNSIKQEIQKQAPVYADTMKAYSEATEQIREIERALSLGGKASVDTAVRKLQSLTRNNVNTNYGNRLALAQEMEQQGGRAIMPALSGQALSAWTPRGLGGVAAGGLGLGGFMAGGAPAAVGAMALQSPRLMGEAAYAAGRGTGAASRAGQSANSMLESLGLSAPALGNAAYQAGRLPIRETEEERQRRIVRELMNQPTN